MAVSNSTDFKQTAQQIIIDARAELGIHEDEEPLENVDLQRGLRALNRMLKAWQAEGVMIWTMTEGTLDLVQGQQSYEFGPDGDFEERPFDFLSVRINRSNDLPMTALSREDYLALPNKTVQGYPTQFYYDRQRDAGHLHIWPTADAHLGTLKFSYRRVIMDVDAQANDFDVPQEWHQALVFGLAEQLIGPYSMAGKPAAARVEAKAAQTYQVVKNFDVGEGMGSIYVGPAYG